MAERKLPSPEDFPSAAIGKDKPTEAQNEIISVRRKKSLWKEVKGEFISEDAPTVGSYLLYDILLPALRDLVSDIGHGALDMAMGTDNRRYRSRGRSRRDDRTYISYDRYWDYEPPRSRRSRYDDEDDDYRGFRRSNRRVPSSEDLAEFIFDSKKEAEDLLREMDEQIDRYDNVSVGYFLGRIRQDMPGDWAVENWGWFNLDTAKIKHAYGGGWHIIFPKIKPI